MIITPEEALDSTSKKLRLVNTKYDIQDTLGRLEWQAPELCLKLVKCCEQLLKQWKETGSHHSLDTIGLINLVAERCGNHCPQTDGKCSCDLNLKESSAVSDPRYLLLLITKSRELNELLVAIQAMARSGATGDFRSCSDDRDKIDFATTLAGQVLIMHLLAAVLPYYEKTQIPRTKSLLSLLLVRLLRGVFDGPDLAHQAYSTYFSGDSLGVEEARSAFHLLYRNDLGVLETVQSRGVTSRSSILSLLRSAAGSKEVGLPGSLLESANTILHGEASAKKTVESPETKKTWVSQISCMIRQIGDQQPGNKTDVVTGKHYGPFLEGIHYRRAQIGKSSTWAWPSLAQERRKTFLTLVENRYKKGHDPKFLGDLFNPSAGNNGDDSKAANNVDDLPVWVQDGEITFLWLMTAIVKGSTVNTDWVTSTRTDGSTPTLGFWDIAGTAATETEGKEHEGLPISLGANLTDFATKHACLFGKDQIATPKMWALFNFLQRVIISGRPARYAEPRQKDLVAALFDNLRVVDDSLTINHMITACQQLQAKMKQHSVSDLEAVEKLARLPTFSLELVLRDQDPTPYSLFFYPISFFKDEGGKFILPSAFVAGTYAGLEWAAYPSVTKRQNYHLFSMLDALRPILDYELGRVLEGDQKAFAKQAKDVSDAETAKKTSEQRRKTFETVIPAVKKLSKLFRDAQSYTYSIESAVDMEWGGLFGDSMHDVFGKLFIDGPLPISGNVYPEPQSVTLSHTGQTGTSRSNLYSRLLYLARGVCGYEISKPLGIADAFSIERADIEDNTGTHSTLFSNQPFLRALTLACLGRGTESSEEMGTKALRLNELLKLLTVASDDSSRGLHIVQLAAALGARGGTKEEGLVSIAYNSRAAGPYSVNPKTDVGVETLSKLLATVFSNPQKASVKLASPDLAPASFLRALSILSTQLSVSDSSLDGKNKVKLLETFLELDASAEPCRLRMSFACEGHFTQHAKKALWEYQQSKDDEYHDLRTNFGVICQAVGGFPLFFDKDGDCAFSDRRRASWKTAPTGGDDNATPFVITETILRSKNRKLSYWDLCL